MSDYDKEVLTASALLERLNTIEANASNIEVDVEGLDRACSDRLDKIESEIKVMHYVVGKNILALDEIEKRIAIMQEKIDGID